ncbi:MAG: Verru_Chthon cassette protein B [Verrucomicrobiae bacterium]
MSPLRFISKAPAFSLVEVVLALGILSIAILPMVALMPQGLSLLGQSAARTERADIVRSVMTHVRQVPFASLPAGDTDWYYDQEGQFLGSGPSFDSSSATNDWLYHVNWKTMECSLPDGTANGAACARLRQVALAFNKRNSSELSKYRIFLCNRDGSKAATD